MKRLDNWHWWIDTNAGLTTRVTLGVVILATLAVVDVYRQGKSAQRWREYGFLAAACFLAMIYGAINDQITSRISWEYFFYGKELYKVLGDAVPPDPGQLHWEAAKVGIKASWSAGLILGVAMLIANNPRKGRMCLRNRRLLLLLPMILIVTIICAAIFGIIGYVGGLNWISPDFAELWQTNLWHPRRFMCTWAVHLGGYLGGALGTVLAIWRLIRWRRLSLASTHIIL